MGKQVIYGHGRGHHGQKDIMDVLLEYEIARIKESSQKDVNFAKECITESTMPLESFKFNKDKKSKKGKYKKNWE